MTPDGINKRDWDKVTAIARQVFDARTKKENPVDRRWRKDLLACLDQLETKYGRLPSIVATRADFCDNARLSVKLWKEAYSLALARGDKRNLTLISSSLAGFMIDHKEDPVAGQRWLVVMKSHMGKKDKQEYQMLLKRLQQLQKK
jgi:hypothetical protein